MKVTTETFQKQGPPLLKGERMTMTDYFKIHGITDQNHNRYQKIAMDHIQPDKAEEERRNLMESKLNQQIEMAYNEVQVLNFLNELVNY